MKFSRYDLELLFLWDLSVLREPDIQDDMLEKMAHFGLILMTLLSSGKYYIVLIIREIQQLISVEVISFLSLTSARLFKVIIIII